MEQVCEELTSLVASIVEPLVDDSEAMNVSYQLDGSSLTINIEVNPDDAGKVVGRQGRVIKSIRTLVRAAASRRDLDVDVELID